MKKICLITSAEFIVRSFLIEPLRVLSREYEVSLVVNTENCGFLDEYELDIEVIPVSIEREIHPIADMGALFRLIRLFQREKFDVIHSIAPKAGLLTMLAGVVTLRPIRIHSLSGQVWATKHGALRLFLKTLDSLTAALATNLLSDSKSQVSFLVNEGVINANKVRVLGDGSIAGVDVTRFKPDLQVRHGMREKMGTPDHAEVVLFLGRLKRDKGVLDLVRAFSLLDDRQDTWLWIVGPDEDGLSNEIKTICGKRQGKLCLSSYTQKPELYMAAADVFVLPSYRESFGVTVLEAAACGLPTIGTRIYGIVDAIQEGKTGLLIKAGDVQELAKNLNELLNDETLRQQLGTIARQRVLQNFSCKRVTGFWMDFYKSLLNNKMAESS